MKGREEGRKGGREMKRKMGPGMASHTFNVNTQEFMASLVCIASVASARAM